MIEVRGLRVVLPPDTVAVDGVDLLVNAGEFVVILGRSGAGKTTFLRALNRLVEPTAGTVRVAGRVVTGAGRGELREARRRIAVIFQQFNLVRRASVQENVLAGRLGYVRALPSVLGRFPPDDRALALECLAQVGLAHLAERRADTLSGGEQQRVAIARALAQSPDVILADEPTASLDPQLTSSIMDILRRINVERRLTLVVSQHQLETALAYATRIVGFRRGRVGFDGPPSALSPAVIAYTTTSLAKLYSEAIEGIEPGPVDAVRATGATRLQIVRYGVLPQVLPLFLSYVLYRLETNIRAATVLGFVGAGGIGFYLQTYLRMIDYPAASTVLLVTVAMVMVVDGISSRLRDRLV